MVKIALIAKQSRECSRELDMTIERLDKVETPADGVLGTIDKIRRYSFTATDGVRHPNT